MTNVAFVSHRPRASEIGMLLITNVLELGVVAPRGRKLANRQHAISERPTLIHTYHAVPMLLPSHDPPMALRGRFQNAIFLTWQGNGMVCLNQTRPYCVNQMGKTQSKALSERHDRGTAWERNGMCESAFIPFSVLNAGINPG
jgi:hypothetical protein